MLGLAARRFSWRGAFSAVGARSYRSSGVSVNKTTEAISKKIDASEVYRMVEIDPEDDMVCLKVGEEKIIVKHRKTSNVKELHWFSRLMGICGGMLFAYVFIAGFSFLLLGR